MFRLLLPSLTLLTLLCVNAWAEEDAKVDGLAGALNELRNMLPAEGTLTNSPYIESYRPYGAGILPQFEASNEVAGGKVLRVKVVKRSSDIWATGINIPITKRVKRNDVLLASVTMRCSRKRCKPIPMGFQQSVTPYRDVRRIDLKPQKEWTTFYLKSVADANFAADKMHISLHLGQFKGDLELGPTFVLNLGPEVALFELPGD